MQNRQVIGCHFDHRARWIAAGLLAVSLFCFQSVANAASYALEITAPRAGLSTTNRYYKAYPGLVYDVQIVAIGGKYPYRYSLVTAPSGMSINSGSGVVIWNSPVAQSQPYSVTAQVTDSAGVSSQVSWTITVTTSGFKFLDAVRGKTVSQGGDGSIGNPWKVISDFYGSKADTTNRGVFLYWRNGTYNTNAAPIEDNSRLANSSSNKPLVWLAYPGESPVIDTTGSHVAFYGGSSNVYVEGLSIQNFTTDFGVRIDSDGDNVVFRRNRFSNLPATAGGVGTNASALMISRGSRIGNYWSVIDNDFRAIYGLGYGLLGYDTNKVAVQGNSFSDFTSSTSKAIGPKLSNQMWFIRDNRITINNGQGIWIDTYSEDGMTRDFEICYNLVQVGKGYTLWVGQEPSAYGAVTSFRNTYVGAPVQIDNLTSSSGPVSFAYDVIVNDTSTTTKVASAATSLLSMGSLLTGTSSTGIVDSVGNLTGTYVKYVGTYGYQRSTGPAPNPPTSVIVN